MKNEKRNSLFWQVGKPFILFIVVLTLFNAVFLFVYNLRFYIQDRQSDAQHLGEYATVELERYQSLPWLLSYWEMNYAAMDLECENEDALLEKERQLRQKMPDAADIYSLTGEELDGLDDAAQRLFAEVCYVRMSHVFDDLKQIYRPLYLYSFNVPDGKRMFYYVTGTKDDEARVSDGGEIFQLGSETPYEKGVYPVMDKVIETGEQFDNIELSLSQEADNGVVHVFVPVVQDGDMLLIVAVAMERHDLIEAGIQLSGIVELVSIVLFFFIALRLIAILRKVVIRPLRQERDAIHVYQENKDADEVLNALTAIDSHNEIQSLAEHFAMMVWEIDRYMDEIQQITAEKERIGAELSVATTIQASMLPRIFPPFPDRKEFDLYATMDPAKEVGGDFYDFFMVDDDHIALVMADVSGKGVPAALFMVIAKTLIKNGAQVGSSPSGVLEYANSQLCADNEAELFVTVWLAVVELSTGRGVAVNAGHEHPALRRAGGAYELVVYRHSPAVAVMDGIPFRQHEFELHPGDRLFVYTDGVPEATNAKDELFGTERMVAALNEIADAPQKEVLAHVRQAVDAFVGDAPQFDDLTMLGFTYYGAAGLSDESTDAD